jgi:hypothetical protein
VGIWRADILSYVITNPQGQIVLFSSEALRYSPELELQMLEDGYTIKINDKRLTKNDIRALLRSKAQRAVKEIRTCR